MSPETSYPFFQELVKPFSKSQQKSLLIVFCAILQVGQARTVSMAQAIALKLRIRFDSAVNRFYRLLRNRRLAELIRCIRIPRK